MKRSILLAAFLLIPLFSFSQGKRMALVIGNSNYQIGSPLSNPVNDAADMAEQLASAGFEVKKYFDLNQSSMKRAIDEFGEIINGAEACLFFYAGHGIQAKGHNYLIPVDAALKNENDVEYNCVDAGRILAKMESAGTKTNIIILDACRDNPFERSWSRKSTGAGLASMDAPGGSIIEYSTSPGKTASDGYQRNSPYTAELLNYIKTPNLKIEDFFKLVRIKVYEKTEGEQIPWEHSSLMDEFYFMPLNTVDGSLKSDGVVESPLKDLLGSQASYADLKTNNYADSRKEISSGIRSIVILPFTNYTGDENNIYLASGMQDALISELGQLGQVRVISKTSTLSYSNFQKTIREIAAELNVDGVVETSLIGLGENVRIQLKLYSVNPEEQLIWSKVFDSDMKDILGLFDRVIKNIADEIQLSLSAKAEKMLKESRSIDPEAYKSYVIGRHYWSNFTPDDLQKAIQYFDQAKEKDKDFALAYLGISDAWYGLYQLGIYPPTDPVPVRNMYKSLFKAIDLDNNLAEAHYSAGNMKASIDWDWDSAAREYDIALSINPNHADTYAAYSNLLASLGQSDRSIEMINKALELDPQNIFTKSLNAATMMFARKYDKSIAACKEVLDLDPNNFLAQQIIAFSYHLSNMYNNELESWKHFLVSQFGAGEEVLSCLNNYDNTEEGYRKSMNMLADTLFSRIETSYFDIFILGMYYACAGNAEKTIEMLELSIDQHNPNSCFLLNPVFDFVRSDPGFISLCKELNLPYN